MAAEPGKGHGASIDYDREIRPIFAGRCQRCHGASQANAGLRLNHADSATKVLESGERAIGPGKPQASELLRRVEAQDGDRMPPAGERLSPQQIDLLRKWIAQGAIWPEHWAYRPLKEPADPKPS